MQSQHEVLEALQARALMGAALSLSIKRVRYM